MDGWRLCLDWVLHLDPDAVAEQKARLAKRHVLEEEQADLRKQDRNNCRTGEMRNDEERHVPDSL